MNTTVPLTDSKPESLGKMTHEENTDPLYSGRNHKTHKSLSQEKVSTTKERHSSHAKPAEEKSTTTVLVSSSTFSSFGSEQEKVTTEKEKKSTLSPHIPNPPMKAAIHEWFTSTHTPAAKTFEETQEGNITADPSSRPTSDDSHAQLEELPDASPDKTNSQYNPTETGKVLSYKEHEIRFPLRSFSSSSTSTQHEIIKNNSEIPYGSATAKNVEAAQTSSQVPTGRPKSYPALVLATTKPIRLPTGSIHNRQNYVLSMNPWSPSENAYVSPVTKENIIATTTTTTALSPPTVHTHMLYPNTPTSVSMLGEPDNANQIPDSDKDRFVTPGQENISKTALSRTYSRARLPVTQFPYQLASASEETGSQELEGNIHKKTTRKTPTTPPLHSTLPVSLQQQKLPGRPGFQGRGSSSVHYTTSGGPQQRPTVVPEGRGRPRITSTDIRSVAAHAETDAYLPCVAVGKPSPFLSWTKVSTGRTGIVLII